MTWSLGQNNLAKATALSPDKGGLLLPGFFRPSGVKSFLNRVQGIFRPG
jgi:hypothetical protein